MSMKGAPKVTITGYQEIQYMMNLISNDIKIIEANLNAKQKLLKKFQDKLPPRADGV